MVKKGIVYFIGAGPGDPELLTIKGKRIIDNSDVIVYAGSLVNMSLFTSIKEGAKLFNSASMSLEEILEILEKSVKEGKIVARVQTGDTSIYSALSEQIAQLKKYNIEFEIIPGVSSFSASAAALKTDFTQPGETQTIICTRLSGKTLVPKKESLSSLAKHDATLCIFLSINKIVEVIEELKKGYDTNTTVSVVYKATWDDQKIIIGNINTIVEKVKKAGFKRQAMIVVGNIFLDEIDNQSKSQLYNKNFSHGFRSCL